MMVVAGLGVAFLSSQPASGAASGWVGDEHASVRLVSAANGVGGDQSLQFGVQFRLAPGWHTYWRSPGDAGVPPVFDWSGSENVQNVTVAWPAPRRVTLLGLETFTYAGALVLPLGVIAFERGMHPCDYLGYR